MEQVLVTPGSFSEIEGLLRLRGNHRLEVYDEITDQLRKYNEEETPGCRVKFITSKKHDTWIEYKVLYKIKKLQDTPSYLSYVFGCVSKAMDQLKDIEMDSIGIQEVYCEDPYSYYVLIYILSKDKEENERREENFEYDY